MYEVIPFVTKFDPDKPDFKQECVDDVTLRPECAGPNPDQMTDEESKLVFDKQDKYY